MRDTTSNFYQQPADLQPYRGEWPNRPTPEQIAEKWRAESKRIRDMEVRRRSAEQGFPVCTADHPCGKCQGAIPDLSLPENNQGRTRDDVSRTGTALLWLGGIAVVGVGAWAAWRVFG